MFSEKLDEVQDGQKQDGTARHDEEAAVFFARLRRRGGGLLTLFQRADAVAQLLALAGYRSGGRCGSTCPCSGCSPPDLGCSCGASAVFFSFSSIRSSGAYSRLRASSSATRVQSGCSCKIEPGHSGVTGPETTALTALALARPLATTSTLRACMMVLMPMV